MMARVTSDLVPEEGKYPWNILVIPKLNLLVLFFDMINVIGFESAL
ncbi:protein of unknown function [Shewanella benthica]|uniref:Uncharacterized protein n=1 Tax=Shewanella benthica TaxID=43661 RepID=A0A330M433_9GAMM|nr:protein of unknown function [Shewanella benthica]